MLKNGAIKEAENFNRIKPNLMNSSNHIIGLKEISEFLNQNITINELKEKVLIRSRQYAKRQNTWIRNKNTPNWLNIKNLLKYAKIKRNFFLPPPIYCLIPNFS